MKKEFQLSFFFQTFHNHEGSKLYYLNLDDPLNNVRVRWIGFYFFEVRIEWQ